MPPYREETPLQSPRSINLKEMTMKTTTTLLAAITLSFAAAGSAFAQDATDNVPLPAVSQLSRAQVQADFVQARTAGTLIANDVELQAATPFVSVRSRDAVRAEVQQTLVSGSFRVLNGERAGFEDQAPVRGVVAPVQMALAAK